MFQKGLMFWVSFKLSIARISRKPLLSPAIQSRHQAVIEAHKCDAGLQVLYQNEWRPVPCLPNTFVVNIGNSLLSPLFRALDTYMARVTTLHANQIAEETGWKAEVMFVQETYCRGGQMEFSSRRCIELSTQHLERSDTPVPTLSRPIMMLR